MRKAWNCQSFTSTMVSANTDIATRIAETGPPSASSSSARSSTPDRAGGFATAPAASSVTSPSTCFRPQSAGSRRGIPGRVIEDFT